MGVRAQGRRQRGHAALCGRCTPASKLREDSIVTQPESAKDSRAALSTERIHHVSSQRLIHQRVRQGASKAAQADCQQGLMVLQKRR